MTSKSQRLAKAQRTVSDGLASPTATLNAGLAMSVSVYVGAKPTMTTVAGTGDATTGTRQTATVSFTPLLAGQSVTVAGLTYKATSATTAAEDHCHIFWLGGQRYFIYYCT
jgi:hypothetical protein